ncbi:hypothetical protein ABZZ79_35680 [Streptomyces sp. NPDC006458]|uniref:hypothetical protein n=1 Tax=Streptomyces sp. NPDC006458 TaxID=3154302 RepID=UPI0033A25574
MTTPASYAFLPWLRRGLAREIDRPDGTTTGAARAAVPITLGIDAAGERRPVTTPFELYGPGEVAALDPRVVIRTVPGPDENDAEPSCFPAVEFAQPDFPWRFTPARAEDTRGRLRPWIVLAVLPEHAVVEESTALGDGTLAAITVDSGGSLPLLTQSWAWAHVQLDGFDAAAETLDEVVRHQPRRVRSRLVAARRLAPRTRYRAFLVPAFERGRLAGLRASLDDTVDALTPAWQPGAVRVRLPVYYAWSFQTGEAGDFETLARRLRARPVDDRTGLRDMFVGAPDPALPPAAGAPLAMEGALIAPDAVSGPWSAQERGPFVTALAALLNRPADLLQTPGGPLTVAPPLWVRWQAAAGRLLTQSGAPPRWFHELNADPRLRAAAGLGADVVRAHDQQLMAEAWNQVEGILAANAELRRAQASRAASERLLERHLLPLPAVDFLTVTAPLHARFTSPGAPAITIHERLRRSPVPDAALDGGLRRALRPAGPVGRRAARLRVDGTAPLLARLNTAQVRARPPVATPAVLVTRARVIEALAREGALPHAVRPVAAGVAVALGTAAAARTSRRPAGRVAALAAGSAALARASRARRAALDRRHLLEADAGPEDVRAVRPARDFVPAISAPGRWDTGPVPVDVPPAQALAAAARFQDAYADLLGDLNAPPAPGPRLTVANLDGLAESLADRVRPDLTVAEGLRHRLTVAPWVRWEFGDPLEPVMAAPSIETPMYEPLRDLGQEWLLPGVGRIPPDTATLLKTNQRFIEAYMAGLSHEMARELLYHEFPTDQRGTYFRQFWDVRGTVGPGGGAADPATLRDIDEIHRWGPATALGAHTGRSPAPREGHVVLLVKGEILRRFPNTLVYAVRTVLDQGQRALGDQRRFPVFEGRLDPDISFYGFDLLPQDVRGDDNPQNDQGWYFMLQEQPTEPVFGLDPDDGHYAAPPTTWNDLNWAQLVADPAALATLGHIDLDAELPDTTQVAPAPGEPPLAWHAEHGRGATGANGSDLAYVTLQRPFRVAIHGSDLLPEENTP